MSAENQEYKWLLVIGLVMLVLGGMNPYVVPIAAITNFVFVGVGLFLVVVAGGNLLVRQHQDKRALRLHFWGTVLAGLGLIAMPFSQLAQNFQLAEWWVIPPIGVALIATGSILILRSWFLRRAQGVTSP